MSDDVKHNPFIFLSTSVSQAACDMLEGIGALTALHRLNAPNFQIEDEMRDLHHAMAKAQAALDNFEACAGVDLLTRDEFSKATTPARGGPTEAHPDAPYCKPDQSCCDFICGN